jgi:uncharacterized protein
MIKREKYKKAVIRAIKRSPVTALLGPRQCGKTTLAREIGEIAGSTFFDLQKPSDKSRLENPELVFDILSGLVIIDEIQLEPKIFSNLRYIVDKPDNKCRFLILGSASPTIIKGVSETLAGRVEFVDLMGFNIDETGKDTMIKLWNRGGFPRSFLADNDEDSFAWREGFVRTFLQRDIPEIGINIPSTVMMRFWMMLANYSGQTWNSSELARSMGMSDKTIKWYVDVLTETYMVRQLQPWYENISKRQKKKPKIYIRDSGLLHYLLKLGDIQSLLGHPKAGASWEGFAIEQVIQTLSLKDVFYWATHSGAEIDMLFTFSGKRYGVEVKMNENPQPTKSMHIAINDLLLEKVFVVYPGDDSYGLEKNIIAAPPWDIARHFKND